jgi:hypothetical protein
MRHDSHYRCADHHQSLIKVNTKKENPDFESGFVL